MILSCMTTAVFAEETVKVNQKYVETFDNATGDKVTDLSVYGLTKANDSTFEQVTTDGTLYISKGDWTGLNSIMYNPSYTYTNNSYMVAMKGKNEFANASGKWMTLYMNFKDINNYYAVRLGGSKWDNTIGGYAYTATVQIVKKVDGVETVLASVDNSGITAEFSIEAQMLDNTITVSSGGKTVIYAEDTGDIISGKYVAFGSESSRGSIDSISVSPMYINESYAEDFNNTTGANITDLSVYGLTKAKDSTFEHVSSEGYLIVRDQTTGNTWNGKNSIMYNPSYEWTNNSYKATIKARNYMSKANQKMAVYLNFKDIDNYYAVTFGATTVSIVKREDGTSTTLATFEDTAITANSGFTADIAIRDNLITVSNNGNVVAYAVDNGEMVSGTHFAFGTESTVGFFDSIQVTPLEADKSFSEDFSDADLTDGTWVNGDCATINSAGRLAIKTKDKLIYNTDWKVYGSDYTLSYTVYNSWKNTFWLHTYFNYQDDNNYYRISFSGSNWDSTNKVYTEDRYLRFTKKTNGTTEEETFNLGHINQQADITLVSEGSSIKVFVNGELIVDKTDETNMFVGGYIGLRSSYAGGWFDNISLDLEAAKAYDGETRIFSLDNMAGKTVTIKKNVDTEVTPLAIVKNSKGLLCAVGDGAASSDKATVEVTLPTDFAGGDLYLYQWSDMNTLVPLAETEKVNLD